MSLARKEDMPCAPFLLDAYPTKSSLRRLTKGEEMELTGKMTGDYFQLVCVEHNAPTDNQYLGWDPSVPHFKSTCKRCNKSIELKLDRWKGLSKEAE